MVFSSNAFLLLFFPVVFALFRVSHGKLWRRVVLTLAGYTFLGYCDWRYGLLLGFLSLAGFAGALLVRGAEEGRRRGLWLGTSLVTALGPLGFFKYYDFAAESANGIAGSSLLPILSVALPLGISFYTFNTLSYIADVYYERVAPTREFWKYLSYISFFPQLVAGPIVRYAQVEDDLEHLDRPQDADQLARGVGLFTVGMIKKVVVADTLAQFVDPMLADYASLSAGGAWAAALGYTFQLYYDFGGYSDMAIGLGLLFGVRLPQNFNAPYRARSITEFWQRWHMSLSTWFRDYVFLPAAYASARRFSRLRLSGWGQAMASYTVATLVTMLLIGLWHGAGWTFVAWGLYHGALLVLDRALKRRTARWPELAFRGLTFLLLVAGWVLFRSADFHMAAGWLSKMVGLGAPGPSHPPAQLLVVIALSFLAANVLPASWDFHFRPTFRWALACALGLFAAYLCMNSRGAVFLYYQF